MCCDEDKWKWKHYLHIINLTAAAGLWFNMSYIYCVYPASLHRCWLLWWRARWTTRGSWSCRRWTWWWTAENSACARANRGASRSPEQRPSRSKTQDLRCGNIIWFYWRKPALCVKSGSKNFCPKHKGKGSNVFWGGRGYVEVINQAPPNLLGTGLKVTLHTPVFSLSNCLKALMRSDLWAKSCSRRTLRAERSVLPMLLIVK